MSVVRVNQVQDTSTNVAANISGGVVGFTNTPTFASGKDPFNSVIETFYYSLLANGSGESLVTDGVLDLGWTRRSKSFQYAEKNSGMSVNSNGIWTFPSTGIWNVTLVLRYRSSDASTYTGVRLKTTTNNSSYASSKVTYTNNSGALRFNNNILTHYMNVTDTTNQKLFYDIETQQAITIQGGSGISPTEVTFIKLCPSV